MIVHKLKFKTCKVLKEYWIFVGFNKIFLGYIFFESPFESSHHWLVDRPVHSF